MDNDTVHYKRAILQENIMPGGGIRGSSIIDDLVGFGNQKDWQEPLVDYAMNYSKQVTEDFKQFLTDYNHGAFSLVKKDNTPNPNIKAPKQNATV